MRWSTFRRGGVDAVTEAATGPGELGQTVAITDETTSSEALREVDESGEIDSDHQPPRVTRRMGWLGALAYGVLPGLALFLAMTAGFLKWQDGSLRDADAANAESVRAAAEGTVALLSYRPDTVETDLQAARGRLTGAFLDAYTSLTHDVVIPGAKEKQISAVATVPASASVSATAAHAVVLLFVNQTVIIGKDAPTNTTSSVRVTLNKVDGRWLIDAFDPV